MPQLAFCIVGIGLAVVAHGTVDAVGDWNDPPPTNSCSDGDASLNAKSAASQLTVEIAKLTRELSVGKEVVRLLTEQLNSKTAELDAVLASEHTSCPRALELSPGEAPGGGGARATDGHHACFWGRTSQSGCANETAAVCEDGACSFVVCPNGGCNPTGEQDDSFIVSTSLGSVWTHLTQVRNARRDLT
jgi:hypothetical protein